MKKYTKPCLWALAVLWQQKTISRANRLRLWCKSINLFLCFLAFADRERPEMQIHGAMICAVLSALYDYETDWVPIADAEDSIYRLFLLRFVPEQDTRDIAWRLFESDRNKLLSIHGLERGSDALQFYRLVIGSLWLEKYSAIQIHEFGRRLQIVDDLLDLKVDKINGHTNCLLTSGSLCYMREVIEFFESNFFKLLEKNSIIYSKLKRRCLDILEIQSEGSPSTHELLKVCRPHTGVFAFFLTIIGFNLQKASLVVGIPAALGFCGITISIMIFNDLADRCRDTKKGKMTASKYPLNVFVLWKNVNVVTLAILALVALISWQTAMFCLVIWALGLLYSVGKMDWPLNNMLVAFCSGAPVLAGTYYGGSFGLGPLFVFGIIFSTIFFTEVVKDIQDVEGDHGHKKTVAMKRGRLGSVARLIALCYLPMFVTMLYPDPYVRATSVFFVGVMFYIGLSFTRKQSIYRVELMTDVFLGAVILVLLFH